MLSISNLNEVAKILNMRPEEVKEYKIDEVIDTLKVGSYEWKVLDKALIELDNGNSERIVREAREARKDAIDYRTLRADFLSNIIEANCNYAKSISHLSVIDILKSIDLKSDILETYKSFEDVPVEFFNEDNSVTGYDGIRLRNHRKIELETLKSFGIEEVKCMNQDGEDVLVKVDDLIKNTGKEYELDHYLPLKWFTDTEEGREKLVDIMVACNGDVDKARYMINSETNTGFVGTKINRNKHDSLGSDVFKDTKVGDNYKQKEEDVDKYIQDAKQATLEEERKYKIGQSLKRIAITHITSKISCIAIDIVKNKLKNRIIKDKRDCKRQIKQIVFGLADSKPIKRFTYKISVIANKVGSITIKDIINKIYDILKGLVADVFNVVASVPAILFNIVKPVKNTKDLKDKASSIIRVIGESGKLELRTLLAVSGVLMSFIIGLLNALMTIIIMIVRITIDMDDKYNENINEFRELINA